MAIWQEQFATQCRVKKTVIIHGNVQDSFWNNSSQNGLPITRFIAEELGKLGYNNIITWNIHDGASGINPKATKILEDDAKELVTNSSPSQPSSAQEYDLGEDENENTASIDLQAATKDIEGFFNILLKRFRRRGRTDNPVAYILDGADAIFGNPNSLSEKERQQLLILGNALRDSECSLDATTLDSLSDILIIVTTKIAHIPPRFYQDNPAVSQVFIGRPDRSDRHKFLSQCYSVLITKEALSPGNTDFEELVDSLEDFTCRDIQQLVHLSRCYKDDPLSFKKLIKLYKYGESKSPWEDLSKDRVLSLKDELLGRVKGQDHVVTRVTEVIKKAFMGFSGLQHSVRQQMPKGTLFFVGPTGVGKTEMAKAIATFLFGEEDACIRFDMSEYSAEHSDQRLLGAPPGYVGYEEGGQLTNAVKRRPFSVILFDEIEKAHNKIFDKFLQVLEDGRLTDSKGETVTFSETIIIFTSNIGAANVIPGPEAHEDFIRAVKKHFVETMGRPELLNRIGESNIIPFNFLTDPSVLLKIADAKLKPLRQKLHDKFAATFEIENESLNILLRDFNAQNGGRGIANKVSDMIIDPLTSWLFEYDADELHGARIVAKINNGQFVFRI